MERWGFDTDGSVLSGTINATASFVDIIAAITLDPFIDLTINYKAIDLAQIYARYSEIGWLFWYWYRADGFHYIR